MQRTTKSKALWLILGQICSYFNFVTCVCTREVLQKSWLSNNADIFNGFNTTNVSLNRDVIYDSNLKIYWRRYYPNKNVSRQMFEKTIWAFETLSRDVFLSWVCGLGPEGASAGSEIQVLPKYSTRYWILERPLSPCLLHLDTLFWRRKWIETLTSIHRILRLAQL